MSTTPAAAIRCYCCAELPACHHGGHHLCIRERAWISRHICRPVAGVAVALQNVILSIAGYFFLIGKFGLRIGDRVQISGVTGEVVEIGLVRIHVMELGGNGGDVQPTGRVVAFSSSFVFQPTAGMFKQITRFSTIRSPRRPGGIA